MRKKVRLNIDRGSWNSCPPEYRHAFPKILGASGLTSVDVFGSLLNIGMMTIPTGSAAACSLAGYWAHVRYSAAIDLGCKLLRLRPEWEDLDSHQKTILSDDWGMGFTTHWLMKRLQFRRFCDGRYFINRLNGLGVASVQRPPKKRGTYKSPDFIFEDSSGRFHIVECKGNQQSEAELERQLNDGIAQKRNIVFVDEKNQVGQRIVAGLYISSFDSNESSTIAVRDPPPENGLVVKLHQQATPFLHDTVTRGDLARNFRLVGSPEIAEAMMIFPRSESLTSRKFRNLIGSLERTLETLHNNNEDWIGRVMNIPFPTRIETREGSFRKARLIYAVQRQFLRVLREGDPTRGILTEGFGNELTRLDWRSEELQYGARIYRGDAFFSELSLSK